MDFLFKNVTAVTLQEDEPVIHNACVGISDGLITHIHPTEKDCADIGMSRCPHTKPARIIDGTNKVLIPALYNTHTHTPMTLLRGYANDRALEDWLFNHIIPAESKMKTIPESVYTGATLAIAEMLASGTVTFCDMYFQMDTVARAAFDAGVKANLSNAVVTFDQDNYEFSADNCCIETLRVLKDYHNSSNGRIKADASIHGVYTSSERAWRQVAEFAREHNIQMQVHLSETKTEHDGCVEKHGMTPTQVFDKYGVFDVPTVAAHAVWVTDNDIEILAQRGVSVAHCPVSNLKLASGIAPVQKMLDAGVNLTLGTDGMASNNSHDLFEEIKLASLLQKCSVMNPTALQALTVLRMATQNGAKALGRSAETGKTGSSSGIIKEGYEADLVLLDFNNPRQTPCFDPLLNLAYSATGRDVCMTMCQGRVLYENGEYKTIDIEKILFDAQKISSECVSNR